MRKRREYTRAHAPLLRCLLRDTYTISDFLWNHVFRKPLWPWSLYRWSRFFLPIVESTVSWALCSRDIIKKLQGCTSYGYIEKYCFPPLQYSRFLKSAYILDARVTQCDSLHLKSKHEMMSTLSCTRQIIFFCNVHISEWMLALLSNSLASANQALTVLKD